MKYYHGTNKSFEKFDLSLAREYKDFGSGMYLSVKETHAKSIALRQNDEQALIRVYDFDINEMVEMFNVKRFKKPDIKWLMFVMLNRNRLTVSEYDMIIGPTADANAQEILESLYLNNKIGRINRKDLQEYITRLKPFVLPEQICILTQNALDYVEQHLIDVYAV